MYLDEDELHDHLAALRVWARAREPQLVDIVERVAELVDELSFELACRRTDRDELNSALRVALEVARRRGEGAFEDVLAVLRRVQIREAALAALLLIELGGSGAALQTPNQERNSDAARTPLAGVKNNSGP